MSNILSIINIHNVNASASNIADNYMDGKSRLAQISQASMDIHKMALSHIVATDYNTMIALIQQIKTEESLLDGLLAEYEYHVTAKDQSLYESLLSNYASFKHALVHLVCASASHKTQDAYALANGDVASYATAMETDIDALNTSINDQTLEARARLSTVYFISLTVGIAAAIACILAMALPMAVYAEETPQADGGFGTSISITDITPREDETDEAQGNLATRNRYPVEVQATEENGVRLLIKTVR